MHIPSRTTIALGAGALVALCLGTTTPGSAADPNDPPIARHSACAHAPGANLAEAIAKTDEATRVDAAEKITRAIEQGEKQDITGRPASGLPTGLSTGVIGMVGGMDQGLLIVVDPEVMPVETMRARVATVLPGDVADGVDVVRSCNSSDALAAAWKATEIDPGDIPVGDGIGRYFEPETEQIVVEGKVSPATIRKNSSSGYVDFLRYDDSSIASRTSRVNDSTPWKGGLRITRHSNGDQCSGGFTVIRNGTSTRAMVTAGHCSGNGVRWDNGSTGVKVGDSTAKAGVKSAGVVYEIHPPSGVSVRP